MTFNQQFIGLVILIVLSAVTFVLSSETALKLENQRFYDYTEPVYVFNVLTAICSVAVGGAGLIELHRIANEELARIAG